MHPCKYIKPDKLRNRLFLFERDSVSIGGGIDGSGIPIFMPSSDPQILNCTIDYSEEESLDERYRFSRTITATFPYRFQFDNVNFIAGIQSEDGTVFLCNPDLKYEVKSEFTLNNEGAKTVLTFGILSNMPLVSDSSTTYDTDCPEYKSVIKPETVKINEHGECFIDDYYQTITGLSGDPFIYFEEATGIELIESIDENGTSEITVTFNTPFDSDNNSQLWHTLELPSNRWNMIVQDNTGVEYYLGFHENGMECSYSVSEGMFNVTFKATNRVPMSVGMYEYENSHSVFWRYVPDFSQCVGNGYAIYTLQAETDVAGRPTGYYKCYVDLLDFFVHLGYNIVDTFTSAPVMKSASCADEQCPYYIDKRVIEFDDYIYTVGMSIQTNCGWNISGVPSWLEVDPTYATGSTTINFVCTTTASTRATVYLSVDGGSPVAIDVINNMGADFVNSYAIDARSQQVRVQVTGATVNNSTAPYTVTSDGIQYNIPENETTSSRTFTSLITYKNQSVTITIEQAGRYEKWVNTTGYICSSGNTYSRQELLYSYDNRNWYEANEYRASGIIAETDLCSGYMERWVQSGYLCFDGKQYNALVLQVSTDSGQTWEDTPEMQLGIIVNQSEQQHFTHCGDLQEQWILTNKTVCKLDD